LKLHEPYYIPSFIDRFFRPAVFRIPGESGRVFLTFDDGPSGEITDFVLDLLGRYNFRATFFVVGNKIPAHLGQLQRMKSLGHLIANHTFNHLNARKTDWPVYLQSIEQTSALLQNENLSEGNYFRPPYGRISRAQIRELHASGYHVIMWNLLSLDYNRRINPRQSVKILKKKIRPGDIVVFHDSVKAYPSMKIILPEILEHINNQAWFSESLAAAF
jgi:peptidoglycan/xylan/chitin deacetylase (PgdA/CDA1 family)